MFEELIDFFEAVGTWLGGGIACLIALFVIGEFIQIGQYIPPKNSA